MDRKTAALSGRRSPHVSLSTDRRETLAFLILAMLSARTTNLSVLASERPGAVLVSSTCRRLRRFFQLAAPEGDPGERTGRRRRRPACWDATDR